MDHTIENLVARHRQIEQKRDTLIKQAISLQATLEKEFGEEVIANGSIVTFEHASEGNVYGYLTFSNGTLKVAYRTSDDDAADAMLRVPEEDRSYSIKELSACKPAWIECLFAAEPLGALFNDLSRRLDARQSMVDSSLRALRGVLDATSQRLEKDMTDTLHSHGCDELVQIWRKTLDATHTDSSDGLTRSSSFLESVCATILRERGICLPRDKSISPLLDACIKCLNLPDDQALADTRQFVGGIKSITNGIGSLRTHFGTAHGASSHLPARAPSFAILAKNSAAAIAIFLLTRHMEDVALNRTKSDKKV